MKPLFVRGRAEVLESFAAARLLVGLDFDGTLAPIVRKRGDARMPPRTRALLRRVSVRYPVAVISGRSAADLRAKLGKLPVAAAIGNHGADDGQDRSGDLARVARWRAALQPQLEGLPHVELEDKSLSLTLHHRRASKGDLEALRRFSLELPGVRLVGGKHVMNLVPSDAPHKGVALERVRRQLGCECALYVGDDVTDEDVFAGAGPRLLTVRVGRSAASRARFYLRAQPDIDALLEALIELRREPVLRRVGRVV